MTDAVRDDVEILWNVLMGWAEEQLKEHGTFNAFGAALTSDDKVSFQDAAGVDSPRDAITAGMQEAARKGEYKATAVICDARVQVADTGEMIDAVHLALDHVDNFSAVVFRPYTIDADKNVVFAETEAQEGSYAMFGKSPTTKKPWWKRS